MQPVFRFAEESNFSMYLYFDTPAVEDGKGQLILFSFQNFLCKHDTIYSLQGGRLSKEYKLLKSCYFWTISGVMCFCLFYAPIRTHTFIFQYCQQYLLLTAHILDYIALVLRGRSNFTTQVAIPSI